MFIYSLYQKILEQWIILQHQGKAMAVHFHEVYIPHLVIPCQFQTLLFSLYPFRVTAAYSLMHYILTLKGLQTFQSRQNVFLCA